MAHLRTVITVTDFNSFDLARVHLAIRQHCGVHQPIDDVSVSKFSTLEAGFCLAEIAHDYGRLQPVIYVNVDPRITQAGMGNNQGSPLVWARIAGGAEVLGPNAGFVLSLCRRDLQQLHAVHHQSSGSQFRSCHDYPQVLSALLRGLLYRGHDRSTLPCLGDALNPLDERVVPPPPAGKIAHVDRFGNLKLLRRNGDVGADYGSVLWVTVKRAGRPLTPEPVGAVHQPRFFDAEPGALSLIPGSSGRNGRCYLELVCVARDVNERGADEVLGNARVEDDVELTLARP